MVVVDSVSIWWIWLEVKGCRIKINHLRWLNRQVISTKVYLFCRMLLISWRRAKSMHFSYEDMYRLEIRNWPDCYRVRWMVTVRPWSSARCLQQQWILAKHYRRWDLQPMLRKLRRKTISKEKIRRKRDRLDSNLNVSGKKMTDWEDNSVKWKLKRDKRKIAENRLLSNSILLRKWGSKFDRKHCRLNLTVRSPTISRIWWGNSQIKCLKIIRLRGLSKRQIFATSTWRISLLYKISTEQPYSI